MPSPAGCIRITRPAAPPIRPTLEVVSAGAAVVSRGGTRCGVVAPRTAPVNVAHHTQSRVNRIDEPPIGTGRKGGGRRRVPRADGLRDEV